MSQAHESFGKYILLEKIQTGGMAEIYLARKPGASGVSKFIAIKRILPQFSEQTEFIEMFKDEAKIAVNLAHANIVSIHEFGIEKNQFFIAMDYVEGRNLRQILNKMKKSGVSFSIEQVLFIVKEVAAGLDHAHRCIDANTGKPLNIIHRDMSPQNVMASFEGEVKVVDFGIAKAETQLDTTRAGTLKGKFGYMSPEQAEGQNVDLRTDIFALGIVLWELLANDRLFVANNEVNTLRKVRDCQIPSLRKINPNIPPELERIVSKALAKDRNLRYQTAAAFHRELSRFLNRQYPDFSPHDFSVFIKTLFASEILESRKKMVEYAKLDARIEAQNAAAAAAAAVPPPPPPRNSMSAADKSNFTHSSTMADNTFNGEMNGGAPRGRPRDGAAATTPAATARNKQNPANRGHIPSITPPNDVSVENLRVDRSSYREREVTSSGTGIHHTNGKTYYGTGSYSQVSVKSTGFSISSLAPVALIAVGLVVGALALFPTNSKMVYTALSKFVPADRDPASKSMEKTEQSSTSTVPTFDLDIKSTPSGAEILINGKPLTDTTPTVVKIPQNEEVTITLRKPGHVMFEQREKIDSNKLLKVALQPERMGRLDINVVGAGQIFVDGKQVATGSPANEIPVRADQEIVVRAEDPVTKAADEVRVRVGENQTKKITLIPRAFQKRGDK